MAPRAAACDSRAPACNGRRVQTRVVVGLLWGVLYLAFAGAGCATTGEYLRGPPPPSALPDPEVRIVQQDRSQGGLRGSERPVFERTWPGPDESLELEYTGIVRRFSGGTPPRFGFFVEIESPDARIRFDVATYRKIPIGPIPAGSPLTVRLRGSPLEETFEIRDEQGAVFAMFVWTSNAAHQASDGVEIHAVEPEAYRVEASDADLCRREDVHLCVRVRAGAEVQRLCPGESRVLCPAPEDCRWFVLVDARETEEHECGRKPPPRWIGLVARVPPALETR